MRSMLGQDQLNENRGCQRGPREAWLARLRERRTDGLLIGLGICAVPVSIALAESLLTASLLFRVITVGHRRAKVYFPRPFWFWLIWAASELFSWLCSPEIRAGQGEIRHLLVIAA